MRAGNSARVKRRLQRRITIATEAPISGVVSLLLFNGSAITMSRLSIFAIVLALGIGPTGSSLCRAFCPGQNPGQECHDMLASVVAADCCLRPPLITTAVAGSESRPEDFSSAPNVGALQRPIEASATSARLIQNEPQGLHTNRLATVLRI